MKITQIFALIAIIILFHSCDRPACKNLNPIFDKYSPYSKEYKAELVKQLGKTERTKLTYWFKEYITLNGEEFLLFDIQGNGLCAVIVLKVEQGSKLEQVRQKKGISFRGAEFTNLKFDILQDSTEIKFIFENFDEIID